LVSTLFETTTWIFKGLDGQVQLSAQSGRMNAFQLLSMVPVFPGTGVRPGPTVYQDSLRLSGSITYQVLSPSGTVYAIEVDLRPSATTLASQILGSWRHPPVATVTQAVYLMQKNRAPEIQESSPNLSDAWILAGGAPAAGQEAYYLFRTVDGGNRWSLERYTSASWCPSEAPQCEFVAGAGYRRMLFWNSNDGVIASASSLVDSAVILRTQNGGETWTPTRINLATAANGLRLTDIQGVLLLRVSQWNDHPPVVPQSINSGQSWILVPFASSVGHPVS